MGQLALAKSDALTDCRLLVSIGGAYQGSGTSWPSMWTLHFRVESVRSGMPGTLSRDPATDEEPMSGSAMSSQ